jgi:phosphatidylserine/phosphatidylglycerophosphate/cardiolipin synthase-like enzyme
MLNLVTTYKDSVDVICEEISSCGAKDQIVFSLYIWEPGPSSIRVLRELEHAVQRNVGIIFEIDRSHVVKFARFVEKTETFIGELKKFQKKYPKNVSFSKDLRPNHKKYYLFKRNTGLSTLIFGSMNLGDRFCDWKDFLVVFKDSEIGKNIFNRFILGNKININNNSPVRIVANEPARKIFEVENALTELFAENAYSNYQVITPYIDRRGIALLRRALEHEAKVQLIIPACANIYQNANMRTLKTFSCFNGSSIYLYKKMIHVKAVLATGKNKQLSCIGSANLKKNSFDKLGEFNGLISDHGLNQQLSLEMDAILKDCKVFEPTPYKKILSRIEEFLG